MFKIPGNEPAFVDLLQYMDTKAREARTNDLGSLRYDAMSYLVPYEGFSAPSPSDRDKTQRGFWNVVTGRMLCPALTLAEFDADPAAFCCEVRSGEIEITHKDYPSFLYDLDEEASEVDGLLKGPFLVACFRHVFTGGRTAAKRGDGPSSGKATIAQINMMSRVHPRHIAYIATLARFLLSSQHSWDANDHQFEGRAFYYEILGLFDGEGMPMSHKKWITDTLAWWDLRDRLAAVFSAMDDTEARMFVASQNPRTVDNNAQGEDREDANSDA
ncbi:hypothetical protein EUX98_g9723 [Antrodiella citrinella]|uniref:Fungal-type protein kinase domain-containing protein n=1 Tax=Antrodiella citrinella TaxID=2447956 RepID=A0A4S4LML0_9APHY|nr:hypothetical protein EUX98_g9723 [Antrodiella citrinella]